MSQTNNPFPWQVGVAMICQKCGLSFEPMINGEEMRKELKSEFREAGVGKAVRVVASSCLGVCNPAEQTVAFFPIEGQPEVVSFSGADIKGQVKEYLMKKTDSSL